MGGSGTRILSITQLKNRENKATLVKESPTGIMISNLTYITILNYCYYITLTWNKCLLWKMNLVIPCLSCLLTLDASVQGTVPLTSTLCFLAGQVAVLTKSSVVAAILCRPFVSPAIPSNCLFIEMGIAKVILQIQVHSFPLRTCMWAHHLDFSFNGIDVPNQN